MGPPLGCPGHHPSLLPSHRGPAQPVSNMPTKPLSCSTRCCGSLLPWEERASSSSRRSRLPRCSAQLLPAPPPRPPGRCCRNGPAGRHPSAPHAHPTRPPQRHLPGPPSPPLALLQPSLDEGASPSHLLGAGAEGLGVPRRPSTRSAKDTPDEAAVDAGLLGERGQPCPGAKSCLVLAQRPAATPPPAHGHSRLGKTTGPESRPDARDPSSIHSFSHPSIHSFVHSSIHSSNHSFIYSPIRSFFQSIIQSSIHSFNQQSFIQSLIPSNVHSSIQAITHSNNHSSIHSFIQSFIQSFIPSRCADLLSSGSGLHAWRVSPHRLLNAPSIPSYR